MKIAKLNIEGYIGELDSKSQFAGEKNFSLKHLNTFLNNLDSEVTDIEFTVNSGGGSVLEGWDIRTALLNSNKTLHSIGENIVGSIATVIYMAAKVENRSIVKGTDFFIHHPYWLPGESEPIRANELLALGKDLKEEQDKLLNFYAKESKATIEQLSPLMAKETNLTSEQAVGLGFAGKEIDSVDFVSYHKYKLAAFIDIKDKPNKQNTMSKVDETILNKFNKLFKNMARVAKGKFFDMDMTVKNESGDEVNLFIESDTEDFTGKSAFEVDADGNQKPANGKYIDADGKTIVVVEGKVTEVMDKTSESTDEPSLEDLKALVEAKEAELNALKAEKETIEANLLAKETENEAIKANVTTLETEFKALKEVIIGEGAEFDLGTQSFKAKKIVSANPNQAYLDEMASIFKKK
jgi:ATP-dependent protease ClpP protease subunit